MILKTHNINPQYSQHFSIEGSSELKFLKVGLNSTGLVLYYMDYASGGGTYYNGVIIREGEDVYTNYDAKCVGVEAGCAVFIEDPREVKLTMDTIVSELELRASSGTLTNFRTYLLRSYEEGFIENVLSRLELKDLPELQRRLVSQAQELEAQLKQKQEVVTQIEILAKELGYQMDFVNKCPAM